MEIKHMSTTGLEFLMQEEGIRLKPYRDSAGIPTIGIGSTYYENGIRVTMKDKPITRQRAVALFMAVLQHYETTVWSITRDDITQKQFDALTSLCYNIGVYAFKNSTVVKRVNNNPNDKTIKDAFLMWKNAGGKPVLLGRRKREAYLYFS